MRYFCQVVDYDDGNWRNEFSAQDAAVAQAEIAYNESAGEIGQKFIVTTIREDDGDKRTFDVTVDWSPDFYATEVKQK